MNKDGSDTLYIDSQFFDDCGFIEFNSPDVATDLLALTAIIYKRRWVGELKDWTDMPIHWGMGKFRVGYGKYAAALGRLVKWGIVQKMEGKEGKYHKQEMYKYVIRDDTKHWETDIAQWGRNRSRYKQKNYNANEKQPEPSKAKTTKTPELVLPRKIELPPMLDGKVCYRILKWNGTTVKFQEVDKDTYAASLTCVLCGNKFDATQTAVNTDESGMHPKELFVKNKDGITGQVCVACGAAYCVEHGKPYFISGTIYSPEFRYKERWLAKEKEITELRDK